MDTKIYEKTMRLWNLRFLDVCRKYNVKIVFYMIRGTTNQVKMFKNKCGIDAVKSNAKIMKKLPKWSRN